MNELMDDGTYFLARELCTYLLSDQSSGSGMGIPNWEFLGKFGF